MLTLYYKPTCPYCHHVLEAAEDLGTTLNLKNIAADPALREELVARGGKAQVPYLVDSDTNTEMYESADIIDYLQQRQTQTASATSFNGVRIHATDEICDSCQ